jgi:DnaJ like chaperone protein
VKNIFVALLCFVIGYWLVGKLVNRGGAGKRSERDAAGPAPPPPRGADERATLSNWYRILGVSEGATREQIVAAYKRRIAEYHPDKVAQMGIEIRELAEAKSKQINAAYEIGMKLFS